MGVRNKGRIAILAAVVFAMGSNRLVHRTFGIALQGPDGLCPIGFHPAAP